MIGATIRKTLPLLAACAILASAGAEGSRKLDKERRVEHALNRLAFGPRPGEVERVRRMGLDKWIDGQLHPERLPQNPVLAERLKGLPSIDLPIAEVARLYPRRQQQLPELRRAKPAALGPDLFEAKLYRAIYSERQLEEVLVDFWFNHFNVYLNKGPERWFVASYERDAIRPHVLGKFRDMLLATARHPAMLFYLDNWQSVDPRAAEAPKRRLNNGKTAKRTRGLNENYARELMELHTLGVDGGYTQEDVVNVARCFTGWTLRDPRTGASYRFAPALHDQGEKTVLGHRIARGRGEEDGLQVIGILAKHPSTARFISTKLAQRFVADQPPAALVDRMAAVFQRTDGDLREVMKAMIASPEFFTEGAWRAKLKSPFEMVVSATRALNADVSRALALSRSIDELGQPLYRKEEPTGYYNTADEWTNTAGLLGRMNFAAALAAGKLPGVRVETSMYETPAAAGLALGGPGFQRR